MAATLMNNMYHCNVSQEMDYKNHELFSVEKSSYLTIENLYIFQISNINLQCYKVELDQKP